MYFRLEQKVIKKSLYEPLLMQGKKFQVQSCTGCQKSVWKGLKLNLHNFFVRASTTESYAKSKIF